MNKSIFFHVGLERTGTTFLQKNVFPFFQGITYVPKKRFNAAFEIISNTTSDRILVSREFNKSFEKYISEFASKVDYPTYPILVLRRHDLWLKSQYKRYLKNGTKIPIEQFFPLNSGSGHLNADALNYFEKIECLEKHFKQKPLVLLHEDLLENPTTIINKIAEFVGARVDWSNVNLRQRHTSYSDHQLRVLFWSYQHLIQGTFRKTKFYRYTILTLAKALPKPWFDGIQLYPLKYLTDMREKYQADWANCLDYIENQSK